MGDIFYCKNCGGIMEFDAASQALKCPNCGTEQKIDANREAVKEHKLTAAARRTVRVQEKKSTTMQCPSCGAMVEVEPNSTAKDCPYCGTAFVLAEKQTEVIIPDGVVPFQIDKNKVGEVFRKWMKGRFFAPNELKNLYQQDKLQGIYLPYWTFDAKADAVYHAEGGRTRVVEYRDSKGERKTRTEVTWYPTGGSVSNFFDDVLVRASDKLDTDLLRQIEPFHTKDIPAYSPDYLSGYNAEIYTVNLSDAHREAREEMKSELRRLAEQDVLRKYDRVRGLSISDNYKDETYKYVLLPVYSTAYQYKNKQYHVLINGETGRVQGEYPKSVAKILLVTAGILILIGLFFAATDAFGGRSGADYMYGQLTSGAAEPAEDEQLTAPEQTYEQLLAELDGTEEV